MKMIVTTSRTALIVLLNIFSFHTFSQSGPGGRGITDGSSNLVLWLRADAGVEEAAADPAEDTDPISTWLDQSGYGYDAAVGGGTPFYDASHANFNSMPAITFVEGNTDWLFIEDDANEAPQLDNTSAISIFYVYNPDNSSGVRSHITKRDGNGSAQSYVFYENGNQNSRINGNNDAGQNITGGTTYINALTYQNGDFDHFLNQTSGGGVSGGTATIPNNDSDLNIGEFQSGDGRTFDGDFAEIIIFREYLTNAERIVVETYLASKYGIALTSDFWDETTYATYDNEIAGIGQHTDATIANSATSAALSISGGDDRANGEWIFWGHDGGDFATYSATEIVTGSSQMRLAREWVVNETNDLGDVTVSIASANLPSSGQAAPTFFLLVDSDGDADFADAVAHQMTLNGANYEVDIDLAEGDHMAIAFVPPVPANVSGTLAFWFDAETGVENTGVAATDGQSVTVWQDLSSNNADGINGTSPTYNEGASVNFRPVVSFDAASSEYLEFDITGLEGADYTIMAVVERVANSANQYILGSQNNAADALYLGYSSNTQIDIQNSSTATSNAVVSGFDSPIEGPSLVAINYNSANLDIEDFRDGVNNTGTSATTTDYAVTSYTGNLGRALAGNHFDGNVSEIVAFSSNLSSGDYNALTSQLSIKYGINQGTDYVDEQANLLWDVSDNTGYVEDVVAIGYDASFGIDQRIAKSAADSLLLASSADFTSLNSNGSRTQLSDGQFVFIANNDDGFTIDQTYNGNANSMLDRAWRIREVGAPGAVIVGVPSASIDANVMLVSTDPTFTTGVSEISLSTSGNYVYASHDFSDGDYFTFVSDASEIWYSYLSGNWNDSQNWTLDGAIGPLYINPDSKIPAAGDSVVIKSGRTITMNVSDVSVTKIELVGTLDLVATSGHNFSYLEGGGTLKLSGASGADNYPIAIDTAFTDALEGGTVEYYGTGLTISQIRSYNNLIINMDNASDQALMLSDSIYVFGDLTIEQGIFQINDASATNDLALQVDGNMLVQANGVVDVGTANARHELNLSGNFTNYGDVDFTNRTSQTTGSDATNGIVDFNVISGTQDQLITLENLTHFYRIEVDKGTDDTYIADIQASDPTYFELYGRANQNHGSVAQLTTNDNAVGLIMGTLKVGTNVDLGALNTGGNYNISEGATLWINGGSTFKNGGTAIVPYGKIRVSSGTLEANINSGITSRGNGTLFIDGGEVTIRQFRTSVFGATNQGGIIQTGGILNVTGQTNGGISNNYYPLNLTYTGNAFNVSGGTINISGANVKGGIFINSDPENINISGGTMNLISNTNNDFLISSRAGFYNVNMTKTSATGGDFLIGTGQSGPGGTDETVVDLPFDIENDLVIDNTDGNTTTFDPQGNNVEIQGALNVTAGSVTDFTDMTLIFDGNGSSSLDIGLATTLVVDSLQINKNNQFVNTNILNGQSTALQIDHYLNVTSGNWDLGAFDITVNGNINVQDTVGTDISTGQIYMNGGAAQSITSSGGAIYDLEIDNTNGVSLSGDVGVIDNFALEAGIFDINTSALVLGNEPQTSGTFGTTLMVETNGNSSDGGLSILVDADEVNFYPIGANSDYSPVTADFTLTSGQSGYVTISIADSELSTTADDTNGDILQYYWAVDHSGFGADLPTVNSYVFSDYDQSKLEDSDGAAGIEEVNFVPGRVLDGDGYVRFFENEPTGQTANVDEATNTITFDGIADTGFTLERANYTAGEEDRFVGTPEIYYARRNNAGSRWNANNSWSTIGPDGGAASDFPQEGDVAIITYSASQTGNNKRRRILLRSTRTIAELVFEQNPDADLVEGRLSRLQLDDNVNTSLTVTGKMSGDGEIQYRFTSTIEPVLAVTDDGDFATNNNASFIFRPSNAENLIAPNLLSQFPRLSIVNGSGGTEFDASVEFDYDMTCINLNVRQFGELRLSTAANGDITVLDSVRVGTIGGGNQGRIVFPSSGPGRTLTVANDFTVNSDAEPPLPNTVSVASNGNSSLIEHKLIVGGNITLGDDGANDGSIDLYNGTTDANVILSLVGEGEHEFNNGTANVPDLYRVELNKGSDTTSVFTMNTDFNLNGVNSTEPPALDLQKGKLVLNDAAITLDWANGIDFFIPEGSGLEVTQGTVSSVGSTLILDGLLKINGGTVDFGTTDIQYSNTGFAVIEVSSGALDVGQIIRRATTTSTGIIKYRQTGGTVLIASDDAPSNSPSRGAFEVTNAGSEFIFTGGTFAIQQGVTGDNNISLLLEPETYDITGSTINLGNANTPNYGATYFNLKSAIPFNNLNIFDDGDDNFPEVRLIALPLTVNGTLDITSNAGLTANGFNVTLNGDFDNDGTYTNSSVTTTLGSATSQSITGAGTFTIFDLTKTGAGTATTNQNLSLINDLRVSQGTLDIQGFSLSLKNDAYVQSTITNSGGNGLVFNGVANQDLYGVPNNAIDIGTITVENSAGVDIPDGNGYDFNVTENLRLNGGVFNIGGSLVTITRGATITEVSTFGANNMVQTNSSFTDNGLRQEFYGVAADTTVFFPIGELKYTPVSFALDAGTTQGDLRVRPANERHPTVIDNTEPTMPSEPEIVDEDNVLQYYWIVVAQDITMATGTATFFYNHEDIEVTAPYDTTNYISARLLSNGINWEKFAPTLFWGGNTSFQLPLSTATSAEITGDYTAGVGSSDGINNDIEGALPDELAEYTTNFSGAGNYSADANWTAEGSSPALSSGIGPVGAIITIATGDDITLNISNIRLYSTHIEAGAILRVPSGSISNRLGTVTGSGTIVLEDTELLPTGEYSAFLQCDGGGLQYSGTTNYSVLSGISQIRNVTFDGTGTRFMPNNALDVCDVLTINGPTVDFDAGQTYNIGNDDTEADGMIIQTGSATISNGTVVNVTGDFTMNGGTLNGNAGTEIQISDDMTYTAGTLNWNNMDVILDGTSTQSISGDFTGARALDNLEINNSTTGGVTIVSGDMEIESLLTLTDGLFNTTSTETLTITSTGNWTDASSASYVTGPMTKENIPVVSTYQFPVGKASRYAPVSIVDVGVGSDDWTAEYFTSTNPTYNNATFDNTDPGSGYNALNSVESTDRWEVTSVLSNTARVRATYGAHNAFPGTNIRLVWWDDEGALDGDAVENRWENQGGQIAGNATAGTVTSENAIFFSTRQFGVGYAPESVLPVELISFDGVAKNGKVTLTWVTASELNNDFFDVQHSLDGINFESIGTVNGNGTTNELITYNLIDSSPALGFNYYRLRQVDYDGSEEFHSLIQVNNDFYRADINITFYPNPASSDNMNLKILSGDDHTPMSVKVIDLTGQTYFQEEINPSILYDEKVIPTRRMASGIYLIKVVQGTNVSEQKIIIK